MLAAWLAHVEHVDPDAFYLYQVPFGLDDDCEIHALQNVLMSSDKMQRAALHHQPVAQQHQSVHDEYENLVEAKGICIAWALSQGDSSASDKLKPTLTKTMCQADKCVVLSTQDYVGLSQQAEDEEGSRAACLLAHLQGNF